jgi:hypothetical protein
MSKALSGIGAEHIRAVNAFDTDAIVATFAEDAYVNDNRREIVGIKAVRRWVEKEMVGDKVTIKAREVLSAPLKEQRRQDTELRADDRRSDQGSHHAPRPLSESVPASGPRLNEVVSLSAPVGRPYSHASISSARSSSERLR